MIGKTNAGAGGSGGMSLNAAVIHVNAPFGSTVTFSKDSIIVKTLGPGKAHTNIDGNNADYYFSVTPTNYGEWVMMATLDGNTASSTVTVSTNYQYDVVLAYNLLLWDHTRDGYLGLQSMASISSTYSKVTDHKDYTQFDFGGTGSPYILFNEVIDISKYSTLRVVGNSDSRGGNSLCIVSDSTTTNILSQSFVNASSSTYTGAENLLDIHTYDGLGRVKLQTGNPQSAFSLYVSRVELLA